MNIISFLGLCFFALTSAIPTTTTSTATTSSNIAGSAVDKRSTRYAKAAILVPAYIYPSSWTTPAAWQPLYDAVSQHPGIIFHVVINPNSGPTATPDSEYSLAITTLRSYANVVLLGYIHTSWGQRSSDAVYADIATYANWHAAGHGMDGVFFDEAPSQATQVTWQYMANITCHARDNVGTTLATGTPLIYFNPGAVPDLRYYTIADYIAIFEDTYATYLTDAAVFAPGTKIPMARSNFMVHSMNAGWNQTQMTSFVNSLANGESLGSVFLTSSSDSSNPYGSFSSDWTQFVAGVDALRG